MLHNCTNLKKRDPGNADNTLCWVGHSTTPTIRINKTGPYPDKQISRLLDNNINKRQFLNTKPEISFKKYVHSAKSLYGNGFQAVLIVHLILVKSNSLLLYSIIVFTIILKSYLKIVFCFHYVFKNAIEMKSSIS